MYLRKKRLVCVFLLFLPQFGAAFFAARAFAENKVLDSYLHEQENEVTLVLMMEHFTGYGISSPVPGRILLTFNNTASTHLFLEHSKNWNGLLKVLSEGGNDLRMLLKLPKSMRETRSTWFQGEHLLCLRFFLKHHGSEEAPSFSGPAFLEHLRFGVKKPFTRMVMGLNTKPLWSVTCSGRRTLAIVMNETKPGHVREKYGPLKRILNVRVHPTAGNLGITISFDHSCSDFRIFWLAVGNRLVLDAFDEPDPVSATDLDIPSWFGKKAAQAGKPPKSVSEMTNVVPEKVPEPVAVSPESDSGRKGVGPQGKSGPKVTFPIAENAHADKGEQSRPPVSTSASPPLGENRKHGKFDPREAKLYGKILKARNLRHADEASTLINRFLSTFPHSPFSETVCFMKGDILFAQLREGEKGMLDRVIDAYEDAVNRFPNSDLAVQAYVNMAKAYSMEGSDYSGISCLDMATRRYAGKSNLALAYVERGDIFLKKNLPEKAAEDFITVLDRYPSSRWVPDALFGIARYLQARGLYREAEKRLLEIEKLEPQFFIRKPLFLSVQAQNCLYLKEYARARELFFQAVNLAGRGEGTDLLLMHIGDTYLGESKPKDAEKFYEMVKKTFPGSEGAAIAELRLGDLHKNVENFKEVKADHPDAPIADIATLKMANTYFTNGLYQRAMENLKDLALREPTNSMSLAAKTLFEQAGEKALEKLYKEERYAELVALFKDNQRLLEGKIHPDKQFLVARSLQELKHYRDAIGAYLKLQPTDLKMNQRGRYYLGLAGCYVSSGELDNGIALLETAAKALISPEEQCGVRHMLADLYKKKGQFQKAARLYTLLIQEKGSLGTQERAEIYLSMGDILDLNKKYQKARDYFSRAVALSERDQKLGTVLFSALRKLGDSYLRESKYPDAVSAYRQALGPDEAKDQPGYWDLKLSLAQALSAGGQSSTADDVMQEVYNDHGPSPRYWRLRYGLALEYLKAGNVKSGEALLKEISDEGPPILQSKAQMKLGSLSLCQQLKRLSIWPKIGDRIKQDATQ